MTFWTKVRKTPKWGVLALKVPPGDVNQSFAGVGGTTCTFITIVSTFSQHFRKSNGQIKVIRQKVSFWTIWGFWGHFWPLLGPWGRAEGFPRKNVLQCKTTYEITICHKTSEKFNGRFSGNKPDARTDGRTGLITIVPFRLMSGD